jgi:hypothetical protein
MKILVNKCPHTGALFESDSKYKAHIAAINRKKRSDAAHKKLVDEFKSWLLNEKLSITDTDMVLPWVLKNQHALMDAANSNLLGYRRWGDKFYPTDEIKTLKFDNITYSRMVSNSHSCPEGGVTYWCGRADGAPRGYPGFKFRFSATAYREKRYNGQYPFSDLLDAIGIKTGSGGGGNENWGYDGTLWLSDWPGLQQQVDEMEMDTIANKLKGVK